MALHPEENSPSGLRIKCFRCCILTMATQSYLPASQNLISRKRLQCGCQWPALQRALHFCWLCFGPNWPPLPGERSFQKYTAGSCQKEDQDERQSSRAEGRQYFYQDKHARCAHNADRPVRRNPHWAVFIVSEMDEEGQSLCRLIWLVCSDGIVANIR